MPWGTFAPRPIEAIERARRHIEIKLGPVGGVPDNRVSVLWPTRKGARQQPLTNDQPVTLVGFSG